jgi:hypothetical protein
MKTTFLGLALLLLGCGGAAAPADPPELPDMAEPMPDLSTAMPDQSVPPAADMAGPKICAFDVDIFEGCVLAP